MSGGLLWLGQAAPRALLFFLFVFGKVIISHGARPCGLKYGGTLFWPVRVWFYVRSVCMCLHSLRVQNPFISEALGPRVLFFLSRLAAVARGA